VRNSKEVLEAAHCIESPYDEPKAHDTTHRRMSTLVGLTASVDRGYNQNNGRPTIALLASAESHHTLLRVSFHACLEPSPFSRVLPLVT
jgi:hypothetical protein